MTIDALHQELNPDSAADRPADAASTSVHASQLSVGSMHTGLVVEFSNGHRNVVRKTLRGWILIANDGRQVVRPVPSPEAFARRIAAIEAYYADRHAAGE